MLLLGSHFTITMATGLCVCVCVCVCRIFLHLSVCAGGNFIHLIFSLWNYYIYYLFTIPFPVLISGFFVNFLMCVCSCVFIHYSASEMNGFNIFANLL